MAKSAVVCGAGGFIASHLVKRLKAEGYWVRGVDIKHPEFSASAADDFGYLICVNQATVPKLLRSKGALPTKFTNSPPTWVEWDLFTALNAKSCATMR